MDTVVTVVEGLFILYVVKTMSKIIISIKRKSDEENEYTRYIE